MQTEPQTTNIPESPAVTSQPEDKSSDQKEIKPGETTRGDLDASDGQAVTETDEP